MNGQFDHFFVSAAASQPQQQQAHPQSQGQGQELSPELVVSLIEKFYNSAGLRPAEIAKINTLLVQVQARNVSLDLPEKLLQHPSPQVRFYAAVLLGDLAHKLSPDLSEDKKDLIRNKYLQYVSFAINAKFGILEFAKLSRACTLLYVSVRSWPDCFRQLVHQVFGDDVVEYDRLSHLSCSGQRLADVPPVHVTDAGMGQLMGGGSSGNGDINALQALVNALEDDKAVLLISFMVALVENLDPNVVDLPEIEKVRVNESFVSTCQSLLPMLSAMMNKESLLRSNYSPTAVISLLLKHSMFLESSTPTEVETRVEYLARSVWLQVLEKLTKGPDAATWRSIEEVVDTVFRLHKSWVSQETLSSLLDFAMEPNAGLIRHASMPVNTAEGWEIQLAARRMCRDIALRSVEANVIDSPKANVFLQLLQYMATAFQIDDEGCEWAGQVVLFWTDYAEKLQTDYNEDDESQDVKRLEALLQPMLVAMTFIFPRLAIPEDPDDDLSETLVDIQLDAQSLFAQAYNLFNGRVGRMHGRNPIPGLIMQTEPELQGYGLASPELAMRTLSGLAENFAADPANDQVVCLVFSTRLFEPLSDAVELSAPMKSREVDACIQLLERYAVMLARNPQFLGQTMEFLFSILETNMNAHDPEVGKAVKAMCLAARVQLIPLFGSLITMYQGLQEEEIYFPEARVDILASFGIVAHAVDQANGNLDAITRAINIVEEEVDTFLSIPDPEETTFTQDGLDALETILELGKLLRDGASKETAISLDDDDGAAGPLQVDGPFRKQAEELRLLVTTLMSRLASSPLLDQNDEAFRAIWDTLRLSQRSKATNLHTVIFDFGPQIYLEVLQLSVNRRVNVDYALETFGQMLTARYGRAVDGPLAAVAREAFPLCVQYMSACALLDDGGDSMNGPLKALLTYMTVCGDIVEEHAADFPRIMDLVTPSVCSSNVFTQEAACDAWSTLLRSNATFLNSISSQQLQELARSLVQQISGEALERAITPLASVLAAMGARGGPCKNILEDAFKQLEGQGVKVANWTRFVQQIFMLRGNVNDTRRMTEQFWRADRLAKTQLEGGNDSDDEGEIVVLDD